jgi:methyl-accepting chemotaxis protein
MRWLGRIPIRTKLFAAFAALALTTIAAGLVGWMSTRSIEQKVGVLLSVQLPAMQHLIEADRDLQQALVAERTMVFAAPGSEPFAKEHDAWEENLGQVVQRFGKYRDLAQTGEERTLIAAFDADHGAWLEQTRAAVSARSKGEEAAALSLGEAARGFEAAREKLDLLQDEVFAAATRLREEATATEERVTRWLLGTVLASILFAGGFALVVGRAITRPLLGTVDALQDIAQGEGDLTRRVQAESEDEIGALAGHFNAFAARIQESVHAIGDNAVQLAGASEELVALSRHLSQGATEVAERAGGASTASSEVDANMQGLATASEEMRSTIGEIARNAQEAATVAADALRAAEAANATIASLEKSSAGIGGVVEVIRSVAEQTNLLALNATIEAARAGESGKGFAVVAGEVKALAAQTASATEDISRRIAEMQADTGAAGIAVRGIREIIDRVNDFQSTIASAVEQQSATLAEIGGRVEDTAVRARTIAANVIAVSDGADSTREAAASADQAAAHLARMAADLQRVVGQFHY